MGFRRSLALLVAGTLVPFLVFSVVAVHQYSRQRNDAAEHALLDAARVHVVALDKHFEATITALRVLGTSEHLDAGDLRALMAHDQLVRREWPSAADHLRVLRVFAPRAAAGHGRAVPTPG